MRRDNGQWVSILLIGCMAVVLTGCGVVRGARGNTPSPAASAPEVTAATTAAEAMAFDFEVIDFVEMNNLFISLLESLPEGTDADAAEAFYGEALEAMLEGDTQLADFYLEQALLLLMELES